VGISTIVALLLGWQLGRWLSHIRHPWRRRTLASILMGGVGAVLVTLPVALLYAFVAARADGATVCPAFVKPALFLPALLGLSAGALSWWRGVVQ
jgi:hypothetical protein